MRKTGFVVIAFFFVCASVPCPMAAQEVRPVSAAEALARLKEGNARFVTAEPRHPDQGARRRGETARDGQRPFAIVLACSDSRVPVEIIFDAGIGDIFVVRTAGNIVRDAVVAGSIEYAAVYLRVPLLVILGHTECGAIGATIAGVPADGNVRAIQEAIEPVVAELKKAAPRLEGPGLMNAAVIGNARGSKTELLARSDVVRRLSDEGALKIVTAVYNIETGSIDWGE